jgi:hypothetical protein
MVIRKSQLPGQITVEYGFRYISIAEMLLFLHILQLLKKINIFIFVFFTVLCNRLRTICD